MPDEATSAGSRARRLTEATLDRRSFLHGAAVLGAASLAGVRSAGAAAPLAGAPAARSASRGPSLVDDFELSEATVAQLQAWMASGRYSSVAITTLYLSRIAAIDDNGPKLASVIETNPEALEIAARMDAERRSGKVRGPLHGIPILLKDVFDTADRMRTTAGSLALADSYAPRDAFVVERLRAAGAVILGKTNLSEWSNCRSTKATSGWSARGGLTRNPYALDRSACGSSSGTGVAIAANLAAIGLGCETDGSIACPASANALVGLRPTVGLVSRSGVIPVSYSQDTPGPMCRTVRDAALLLNVLAGEDGRDFATAGSAGRRPADYTTSLDRGGLRGMRLGVLRRQYDHDPTLYRTVDVAIKAMTEAGAVVVVDPLEIPTLDQVQEHEVRVLLCEFKDLIGEYLVARGPQERHKSLADLIRFNIENADVEMRFFGQEWFEVSQQTDGRASDGYRESLAACRNLTRTQGVDRVMREHQLDAIVGLTTGPAFTADLINGDHGIVGNSALAAVAGYPSITVPGQDIFGLPVGISFTAEAWSEAKLLRMAYAFEQATRHRHPPRFLPTVSFDR